MEMRGGEERREEERRGEKRWREEERGGQERRGEEEIGGLCRHCSSLKPFWGGDGTQTDATKSCKNGKSTHTHTFSE